MRSDALRILPTFFVVALSVYGQGTGSKGIRMMPTSSVQNTPVLAQSQGGGTKGIESAASQDSTKGSTSKAEGEWKGKWGQMPLTLKLVVEGKTLIGTLQHQFPCGVYCNPGQTEGEATENIEDGRVDRDTLEFKCEIVGPEGRSFTTTFRGVIEQDRLTLTPQDEHSFVLNRN